jgi:hypothetical protein
MKKIIYNGQMRNEHFLIVNYHSSLVKGAMNAAHASFFNGQMWTKCAVNILRSYLN